MTTKVDDNQITPTLLKASDAFVRSLSSSSIDVSDDGQGNLTLSYNAPIPSNLISGTFTAVTGASTVGTENPAIDTNSQPFNFTSSFSVEDAFVHSITVVDIFGTKRLALSIGKAAPSYDGNAASPFTGNEITSLEIGNTVYLTADTTSSGANWVNDTPGNDPDAWVQVWNFIWDAPIYDESANPIVSGNDYTFILK